MGFFCWHLKSNNERMLAVESDLRNCLYVCVIYNILYFVYKNRSANTSDLRDTNSV